MKIIVVIPFLSALFTLIVCAGGTPTAEGIVSNIHKSRVAVVGKLTNVKTLSIIANGELVTDPSKAEGSGYAIKSGIITPEEILFDSVHHFPEEVQDPDFSGRPPKFTKKQSISVVWTEQIIIKTGESLYVSACPPIQRSTFAGDRSIILLKQGDLGNKIAHSYGSELLESVRKGLQKSYHEHSLDVLASTQNMMNFQFSLKNAPDKPELDAFPPIATATNFLFAATAPFHRDNSWQFGLSHPSRQLHTLKNNYLKEIKHQRDTYAALIHRNEETLKVMNNIVKGVDFFFISHKREDPKFAEEWSSTKKDYIQTGFNKRFLKLYGLVGSPSYILLPKDVGHFYRRYHDFSPKLLNQKPLGYDKPTK